MMDTKGKPETEHSFIFQCVCRMLKKLKDSTSEREIKNQTATGLSTLQRLQRNTQLWKHGAVLENDSAET